MVPSERYGSKDHRKIRRARRWYAVQIVDVKPNSDQQPKHLRRKPHASEFSQTVEGSLFAISISIYSWLWGARFVGYRKLTKEEASHG